MHTLNNAVKDISKIAWISSLAKAGRGADYICNHNTSLAIYSVVTNSTKILSKARLKSSTQPKKSWQKLSKYKNIKKNTHLSLLEELWVNFAKENGENEAN